VLRLATPTAPNIDYLEHLYSGYLLFQLVTTGIALLFSGLIAQRLYSPINQLLKQLRSPEKLEIESEPVIETNAIITEFDEIALGWAMRLSKLRQHLSYTDSDKARSLEKIEQLTADLDAQLINKKQFEDKLIEARQRLSLITQYAPIAIIEWQPDQCISAWNPAAEKLLGYKASEVIGQDLFKTLLPETGRVSMLNTIQDLMDMTGGLYSTHQNVTHEGRILTCEWFSRPLVTAGGRIIGFVSIVVEAETSGF
jgi:PAS domain S-box-containing protein